MRILWSFEKSGPQLQPTLRVSIASSSGSDRGMAGLQHAKSFHSNTLCFSSDK